MEFKAKVTIEIDLDEIIIKVVEDTINEIKRLISTGKNIHNNSLKPKKNGEVPTFYDTGRLLNSISYEFTNNGIEIYISDEGRVDILDYIQQKVSWVILDDSDYIEKYMDKRLQYYLDSKY